jgi:CheY-like chemotaxis protein
MEQQAALLQAIGGLIGVISWPTVVVVAALVFRNAIKGLLGRDELSVKGPAGFTLTARRYEAAARDLMAATAAQGQDRLTPREANDGAREVDAAARELGHPPHVLWVDDHPSSNRSERAALERLGLVFALSTSTDGAIDMIARRGPYDLVISDMERDSEPRAGYQLLDRLRASGDETPYIIYAGSRAPEHFDEAVRHGAMGTTDRPSELVQMVTSALRGAGAVSAVRPSGRAPRDGAGAAGWAGAGGGPAAGRAAGR